MQFFDRYQTGILVLFFGGFLLLGLWVLPDYGVCWDSAIQRHHGLVSVDYVNDQLDLTDIVLAPDDKLKTYEHRYYGVLFQMVCTELELVLGLETFRQKHLLRHHMVFLLFWMASIAFFFFLKRRYKQTGWALLGSLMLILSPRIFGHAFFNIKDSVLLSTYLIAGFTLWRFYVEKSWKTALLHGLMTGIVINARILGVLIPVLTIGWILVDAFFAVDKRVFLRSMVPKTLVYLAVASGFTILFWPYLWKAPVANFLEAFEVMGNYDWQGDVLLFGDYLKGHDLPWYYAPAWITLTTPLLYVILGLIGIATIFWRVFGSSFLRWEWYKDENVRFDLVSLSLFIMPLLIVIVKGSTLYDGWRQLHFIYPFLVATALAGFWFLLKKGKRPWVKTGWKAALGLTLLVVAIQMVRFHPHQQVYFNITAGTDKLHRFELDYWGVSYRTALLELLERDTSSQISFYARNYPGNANYEFLTEEQQARLKQRWSFNEDPKYFITNFRDPTDRKNYGRKKAPLDKEFFSVSAYGTPIIGVFQLKE
jgi:hypothetical protein